MLETPKYSIKETKQSHKKMIKYIYEFCIKNKVFFIWKVIVGYKNYS